MYFISDKASRIRQREAQRARENRLEIVKAVSQGTVSRRDLYKWGIYGATGALALKNGLSPFAKSAFAAVPTGAPRSPLFGAKPWADRVNRLDVQTPVPLTKVQKLVTQGDGSQKMENVAVWGGEYAGKEPDAPRLS